MTFDPRKPVETRDGRPARIICWDKKSSAHINIVALIKHPCCDEEIAITCDVDGSRFDKAKYKDDLVNIPVRTVRYVNVPNPGTRLDRPEIRDGASVPFATARSRATDYSPSGQWSTVKLIFEDGKLINSEVIR